MSDDPISCITGVSEGDHPEIGRYFNVTVEGPCIKGSADMALISDDARSGILDALFPSLPETSLRSWSLDSVESYLDGVSCEVTFKFSKTHQGVPGRRRASLSAAPEWAVDCLRRELS